MRALPRSDDRGETLIELVIAVAIMGVVVVTLLGAIATSIRMSDIHRKQARAGAFLRSYAEEIQNSVAGAAGYKTCAVVTDYPASSFAGDVQLDPPTITTVTFWNPTAVPPAFVPRAGAKDIGVQRLSLRLVSKDTKVSETLDLVLRRPAPSATTSMPDVSCP
jgi:type II secretory pathway pseudopilin PulG